MHVPLRASCFFVRSAAQPGYPSLLLLIDFGRLVKSPKVRTICAIYEAHISLSQTLQSSVSLVIQDSGYNIAGQSPPLFSKWPTKFRKLAYRALECKLWNQGIPGELGQHPCCWCPDLTRCGIIKTQTHDCTNQTIPFLPATRENFK